MLPVADIHVGSEVISMLPHPILISGHAVNRIEAANNSSRRLKNQPPAPQIPVQFGSRMDKSFSRRLAVLVGTNKGSLGVFIPLEEKTYRRLMLLQQLMTVTVPSECCLNPRDFRSLHLVPHGRSALVVRKRGILDGNLLYQFVSLDCALQHELAAVMGTSVDLLLENLQELDLSISFF